MLDPFAGSGTTLVAAINEGFDCIGCELQAEYIPIIQGRCAAAERKAGNALPLTVRRRKPKDGLL